MSAEEKGVELVSSDAKQREQKGKGGDDSSHCLNPDIEPSRNDESMDTEAKQETLYYIYTRALRENVYLGVVIWMFALLLCIMYFTDAVPQFFEGLESGKQKLGRYPFAFIFSGISAGLLPTLYALMERDTTCSKAVSWPWEVYIMLYNTAFFGTLGVYVTQFYTWQAIWFGDGGNVVTIIAKTLMDQMVFTPFVHLPVIFVCFTIRDCGHNPVKFGPKVKKMFTKDAMLRGWWAPALVGSTWLVWYPSLAVIYSLPGLLQQPIQALISFLWVILQEATKKASTAKEDESIDAQPASEQV